MVRILLVLGVAAAVFWIFSIIDTAFADRTRVRGIPKLAWVLLVVLLPLIGGAMWLAIGRPRKAGRPSRMVAPDDDLDFVGGLRSPRAWEKSDEEELQRLERELRDMDERATGTDPSGKPSDNSSDNDASGRRDG